MDSRNEVFARLTQDAAEDFRQAAGRDDLWTRLNRQLGQFAITGNLYGAEAFPGPDQQALVLLDSLKEGFVQAKLDEGLFYTDLFVQVGLTEPAPILWSDSSRLSDLSAEAKRSLDMDWDFAITTGVTIPTRFAGGLGAAAHGCHADGLSWLEFDRVWTEHGDTIIAIVNAFDTALRRDHVGEVFPLTPQERECLLWLAAGLPQKQIADRLLLSDKQVEKRLAQARRKLKAVTTTQAVANALIFGVIDP
ncbi:MAG: autoinducer binding domain-containing protein [Alphaproteobacteria bacterium]|nr:autoinducer binding domain-containing protein [Alphaproteobacteria bacterium]MBF0375490.1 autoinducer binding domain-containing protein [Alphaproteobacteria bacterium]